MCLVFVPLYLMLYPGPFNQFSWLFSICMLIFLNGILWCSCDHVSRHNPTIGLDWFLLLQQRPSIRGIFNYSSGACLLILSLCVLASSQITHRLHHLHVLCLSIALGFTEP